MSSLENISARTKSKSSILSKLQKKFNSNALKNTDLESCTKAIADAYGTRVSIKSLSPEQTENIIEEYLTEQNSPYSKEDVINFITSNTDYNSSNPLAKISSKVINKLKTAQTQEVVDRLIEGIKDEENPLNITELNNYGDSVTSYFTKAQVKSIAKAYQEKTGKPLKVVSLLNGNIHKVYEDDDDSLIQDKEEEYMEIKDSSPIKESGYSTSQMNVIHYFKDNTKGLGELQVRGSHLNEFSNAEHLLYDIREGKKSDKKEKIS